MGFTVWRAISCLEEPPQISWGCLTATNSNCFYIVLHCFTLFQYLYSTCHDLTLPTTLFLFVIKWRPLNRQWHFWRTMVFLTAVPPVSSVSMKWLKFSANQAHRIGISAVQAARQNCLSGTTPFCIRCCKLRKVLFLFVFLKVFSYENILWKKRFFIKDFFKKLYLSKFIFFI